jgi:ferredoxin
MTYVISEPSIGSGACEPECPVEAIFPEDALPEKWTPFVHVNASFVEGGTPAVGAALAEHRG